MRPREGDQGKFKVITICCLAVVCLVVFLLVTAKGIGATRDSATYIGAARNLLDGKGLSVSAGNGDALPLTHFPPLYPIVLYGISCFGLDPLTGARFLGALLLLTNILLVGFLIHKFSRGSILAAFLGSFTVLFSIDILTAHTIVFSEPLFIFLLLLGLYAMVNYLESDRYWFLILSSLSVALAFLTRYMGISLIVTGVIALLAISSKPRYRKIRDAVLFLAITLLPSLIWIIRNLVVADNAVNRELVFHPINLSHIKSASYVVSTWIFPVSRIVDGAENNNLLIYIFLGLGTAAAVVIACFVLRSKHGVNGEEGSGYNHEGKKTTFVYIFGYFIIIYAICAVLSISFIDAEVKLDDRILAPIFILAVVISYSLLGSAWRSKAVSSRTNIFLFATLAMFILIYLVSGTIWISRTCKEGQGYISKTWEDSQLIALVDTLPEGTTIYSNEPYAIYIITGRPASSIPSRIDARALRDNDQYLSELAAMREQLLRNSGYVIYFSKLWPAYMPREEEIVSQIGLDVVMRVYDGAIYTINTQMGGNSPEISEKKMRRRACLFVEQ
jgi:4-amino-4-deoxy-L-arabinose transferase-like glycosyltransferase